MKINELFDLGILPGISESFNKVLNYKLIHSEKFKDIEGNWYALETDPELEVATESRIFNNERIGEVSFYYPSSGFSAINKFDVGEAIGILSTVIEICKIQKVDTWYFSAKTKHSAGKKELLKRTSLYFRVAKKMAAVLNWNFKVFSTSNGDNVYIVSKFSITTKKIYQYAKFSN
jgi:hypothetical protein